jgi:crossover junction endodeoxyribonuclease RuvC
MSIGRISPVIGGCDPGLDGAFAIIQGDDVLATLVVPTIQGKSKGRQMDETLLEQQFRELCVYGPEHFGVEQVSAMPKQGSVSMFKFGECFGFQKGLISGERIPRTMVAPIVWKRELGLGSNKEGSLDRAGQLFPKHVKLFRSERGVRNAKQASGIAEACLIAYYVDHYRLG